MGQFSQLGNGAVQTLLMGKSHKEEASGFHSTTPHLWPRRHWVAQQPENHLWVHLHKQSSLYLSRRVHGCELTQTLRPYLN